MGLINMRAWQLSELRRTYPHRAQGHWKLSALVA